MNFLAIEPGHTTPLPKRVSRLGRCHQFDSASINAVNAALGAKRPLLVRGEPGVGKTQLAEAVAHELNCALVSFVVDSRTESRDLMWRFDAVLRLAEAQLFRNLGDTDESLRQRLDESNFVQPGPLWWAFDHTSAETVCKNNKLPTDRVTNIDGANNGWVVLIDEIDKAETDVPNGLLEALGSGEFHPPGQDEPIRAKTPPLILITTNEERVLPDAFLRRCLVLHLRLPATESALTDLLVSRGQAHFDDKTTDAVLREAATLLVGDRKRVDAENLTPLPGQAEYLDLMRSVIEQKPDQPEEQKKLLSAISRYVFLKHPELHTD